METDEKVAFRYYKSQGFRVVHSDGAFGGLTPRRGLFLSFYSERFPIPEVTVHHVSPEGTVTEEIRAERQTKREIIREVEIGVVMDLEVAKSLLSWLTEKVAEVERTAPGRSPQSTEKE